MASLLTLFCTISVGKGWSPGRDILKPDLVPEVKIACRKEGKKIACGPAHLPRESLGYSIVLSADREVHPRARRVLQLTSDYGQAEHKVSGGDCALTEQ